jgi:asparagine synthase (glutamine-hydrolysing)
MWAFAIWDNSDHTLFLSRDRFGVKPLYFLNERGQFLFASELKAFMSLPFSIRPQFDDQMIARMKNEESIDQTLLQNVINLNAGCCLTVKHKGVPKVRRWWRTADHLETVPLTFQKQVERYKELFFDACRIRMRSDVPICTSLSGGLDSSSTLCAMSESRIASNSGQRLADDWKKAFILVYSDTAHDERMYADQVIAHIEATPIYQEIDPNNISVDHIEKAILGFEAVQNAEPSLGPWLIYKKMREHGTSVAVDGLGGDETLAGYHDHLPIALKDAIWPLPDMDRWRDLQDILSGLYASEISESSKPVELTVADVAMSLMPSKDGAKDKLVSYLQTKPVLLSKLRQTYRFFKNSYQGQQSESLGSWLRIDPAATTSNYRDRPQYGTSFLDRYLYEDFHHGTNARSLRNFDRMSMAHGVESRAPFMDWRLVCYAFSLPVDAKLGSGCTKRILREAMCGVLPEGIRTRKSKLGFASPMPSWYSKSLGSYVLDTLSSKEFLESDIWNGPKIQRFTEKCFKNQDFINAVKSWKYIQAQILMKNFQELVRL